MDGVEGFTLRLLGGFELSADGAPVEVPEATRKVIAYVALQPRACSRAVVAAQLWPDKPEPRAAANLRSALWRLRGGAVSTVIDASASELALRRSVALDVRALREAAARVLHPGGEPSAQRGPGGHNSGRSANGHSALTRSAELRSGDAPHRPVDIDADPGRLRPPVDAAGLDDDLLFEPLLPGWSDPWAITERERLAQLQLHLLDVVIAELLDAQHTARAIDLALRLVALDPLRERSQCGLVAAYAAEGSLGHAQRQFARYCELVQVTTGRPPRIAFEQAAAGPSVCMREHKRIDRPGMPATGPTRAERTERLQPT